MKGAIVFSSGKEMDLDVWTLNLETKEIKQLTTGKCKNDCPKWSPDGNKIVFLSEESGCSEIWVMDADGSNSKQITSDRRWKNTPAWSPDGSKIVFSANYDSNFDIYVMDANGENMERITTDGSMDYYPQFSPDGKKIIFTSKRTGNPDIWTYDCESKELSQLTEYDGRDYAPTYSPDGTQIAFISGLVSSEFDEDLEVYLMDADGQNKRRVTAHLGEDRHVAWSPCGKYLVYTVSKPKSSAERIHILDIEKSKTEEMKFDRTMMDKEIDSEPLVFLLFALLPVDLVRKTYPESYFGTERYPDWKY